MTGIDSRALRRFVYDRVVEHGAVPSLAELGDAFGTSADGARRAVEAAGLGKTLMPDPETGELWMIGPFSGKPTRYRVEAAGKVWFANCAWDAFGVHALVGAECRIATVCDDCQSAIDLVLPANTDTVGHYVVHFLVPARHWYRDIGYT